MKFAALVVLVGVLASPVAPSAFTAFQTQEAQSPRVFAIGYVNKPGSYYYADNMTVVQLIAMAGGVKKSGSFEFVIVRKVNGERQDTVARGSEILQPSDIVSVR